MVKVKDVLRKKNEFVGERMRCPNCESNRVMLEEDYSDILRCQACGFTGYSHEFE